MGDHSAGSRNPQTYIEGNIFFVSLVFTSKIHDQVNMLLQDHAGWVNSLSLSTEYVLRTGAFDHTRQVTCSDEEMKKVTISF